MGTLHPASVAKRLIALAPKDYAATAPTTENAIIDTRGYQFCEFLIPVGLMAGTGIACKVQHDTDPAFGTGADISPSVNTPTITTSNDNGLFALVIDCRKVNRYLRLVWTFDTVTVSNLSAAAVLYGPFDSGSQVQDISDSV